MARIRAVLFDMDGVLVEAKDWHYEALNRALSLFGMTISRDEHLALFDGLPTRRKLEILSASRGLPRAMHGFLNNLKQRYTVEIAYAQCRPRFQHQYTLSRLRREGYVQAVCSNSVANTVKLFMELSGLSEYLDLSMTNEDVSKAKPDPEMYLTAMKRLGLSADACLILEDNDHGIRAAQASGAHVFKVADVSDVTYARIRAAIDQLEA